MFHDREEGQENSKRRGRKVPARPAKYRNGDWQLGRRGKDWVAEYCGPLPPQKKRGERVRIGQHPTFEDACRALDTYVETSNTFATRTKATLVQDIWDKWLAEREKDGFSNEIYKHNWKALKPHFGHKIPEEVTADDCRDYAKARFALGRAPQTVHTELIRLRHCFNWAMANRKVGLCIKVWTPSKGKGRKTRLERDEAVRLMDAAKKGDPHIALFTAILFCTGARHHAINELEWDRIDFVEGTIDFETDEEFNPMSRSYKKGRAKVLMSRVAREMLVAAYVGRQTNFVIEHGGKPVADCRGGFANAVKRAGLTKKVTPHTIRHTVVSWLQDEPDIQTRHTSQLVGHVDEATTRIHYTHMSPEALRKVVDVLDSVFGALPTSEQEEAEKQRSEAEFRAILSRLGRAPSYPGIPDNSENP